MIIHLLLTKLIGLRIDLTLQSKDNNSSITDDDTLMKLQERNHTMVIYINYKFHEIPFIIYLVMASDPV